MFPGKYHPSVGRDPVYPNRPKRVNSPLALVSKKDTLSHVGGETEAKASRIAAMKLQAIGMISTGVGGIMITTSSC